MPENGQDFGGYVSRTRRMGDMLSAIHAQTGCPISHAFMYAVTDEWNTQDQTYQDVWHTDTVKANFLDIGATSGFISYLPAGREYEGTTGRGVQERYVDSGQRQAGKAGKVVRMCMTKRGLANFTDKQFEDFSNYVKAQTSEAVGEFKIVSGGDIPQYFLESMYARNGGNLFKSCMRYDKCQPWLDLYALNPDNITMLVKLDQWGKVIGRAMRWVTPTQIYLDRVYGNDATVQEFRNYAHAQGWAYKQENSIEQPHMYVYPGHTRAHIHSYIDIPLVEFPYLTFPYLDTMKYFAYDANTLHNYEPNEDFVKLIEQEGGPHRVLCAECAEAHFKGRMNRELGSHRYYCNTCWNKNRCTICMNRPRVDGTDYCRECTRIYTCRECGQFATSCREKVCLECRKKHICQFCGSYETQLVAGLCTICDGVRQRQQARLAAAREMRDNERAHINLAGG